MLTPLTVFHWLQVQNPTMHSLMIVVKVTHFNFNNANLTDPFDTPIVHVFPRIIFNSISSVFLFLVYFSRIELSDKGRWVLLFKGPWYFSLSVGRSKLERKGRGLSGLKWKLGDDSSPLAPSIIHTGVVAVVVPGACTTRLVVCLYLLLRGWK